METRKVLEMGGGTMLISLPKAWAKKNKLARGSSVFVEEISSRRLMVRPISNEETDVKTVIIEITRRRTHHT